MNAIVNAYIRASRKPSSV